ncbi:ArsR/SmtB family transcription factor [Hwanghaeella sp.]|uniref:ArsR/SmtB family transcription factor n=1 Tax=Hwanghaeella sp. TaxID=2605943 RepID=UPI003CCB825A
MPAGPNIAIIAGLVGDPARAGMLSALMAGRALTASELAQVAGVTVQTASSHLSKLSDGGLIVARKQGRHRYFTLSGDDVAQVLEGLMGLAERILAKPVRTGPKDPGLRKARICYDHLAGEMGVGLFQSFVERGLIKDDADDLALTEDGRRFFTDFGLDMGSLESARRPVCRPCLDWSARRTHLAGGLGAAILDHFTSRKWAWRVPDTRMIEFSPKGLREYQALCSG